jgi:hypothetical protein
MVITNQNPLAMEPRDLRQLRVEQLFLSGKKYEPGIGLLGILSSGITRGGVTI